MSVTDDQPAVSPDRLGATRAALHAVAEQVLAGTLHRSTGRIGLRRTPGGFGTPPFGGPGGVWQILVVGTEVVVRTDDPRRPERRAPITTVAAAARLVGVAPGAPDGVYPPATPVDPDRPLTVDPAAADHLAGVLRRVDQALGLVLVGRRGRRPVPAPVQLWPEHFDLATTVDEVNLGGSPGDDEHPEPYVYVGPWARSGLTGPFWNEPFGASRPARDLPTVAAVSAFLEDGLRRSQPPDQGISG